MSLKQIFCVNQLLDQGRESIIEGKLLRPAVIQVQIAKGATAKTNVRMAGRDKLGRGQLLYSARWKVFPLRFASNDSGEKCSACDRSYKTCSLER